MINGRAGDIPGAVADAVGGLQSVVVQDVALRLVPVCGCTIKRVHTGWPVHVEDSGDVVVRVPRMSIANRKDILMSITLPKCSPNPHFEKLKKFISVKEGSGVNSLCDFPPTVLSVPGRPFTSLPLYDSKPIPYVETSGMCPGHAPSVRLLRLTWFVCKVKT